MKVSPKCFKRHEENIIQNNMQYNILINQKSVVDNDLIGKLDLVDLALFDFVYHFMNSESPKKQTFTDNGITYVEIRLTLIQKEMPLLGIKTRYTFINKMNNLIDAGLIERYERNTKENRCGFKKGKNFSIFVFEKEEEEEESREEGCSNNEYPVNNNQQTCGIFSTPPVESNQHNHNNKDNIITKEERDKSLSKKETEFVERMYDMYPAKCPVKRRSLGKCRQDKARIHKLLKYYTMEQIERVIIHEVSTKYGVAWMSNFSTFLNNFPDPTCIEDDTTVTQTVENNTTANLLPPQDGEVNANGEVWSEQLGKWLK